MSKPLPKNALGPDALQAAIGAFLPNPALHFVYNTYSELLRLGYEETGPTPVGHLASATGCSTGHTYRALRVLERLGVITRTYNSREGACYRVQADLSSEQCRWFTAIRDGLVVVDPKSGTLSVKQTGKVYAYDALLMRFVLEDTDSENKVLESDDFVLQDTVAFQEELELPSTTLSAIATSDDSESGEKVEKPKKRNHIVLINTVLDLKDKVLILRDPRKTRPKKIEPKDDPLRPAIERIQEVANEVFGYRRSVLSAAGKEIGDGKGLSRYRLIRRALTDWELTEEYCCGALRLMATDESRKQLGYLDTINIFRHLATLQQYGDAWERGVRQWANTKGKTFDRRSTHLAKDPTKTGISAEEF